MATKRKTTRKHTKRGKERRSNGVVDKALQNPKRADWFEKDDARRWGEWLKTHSWKDYGVTWL